METIRRRYKILVIVTLFVFGLTISVVNYFALRNVEETYQENAGNSIIEVKKSFLQDTVNNVILSIENKQVEQREIYLNLADDMTMAIKNHMKDSDTAFLSFSKQVLAKQPQISSLVVERSTGEIAYQSDSVIFPVDEDLSDSIEKIKNEADYFSLIPHNQYDVMIYINPETIHDRVKILIHDEIHAYRFSNDAYVWVNKVMDYNGGDNYAIRRVHPNLKDTEGIFLSTSMTDIAGNHPYRTELEGVKQDGELFFSYFFKKLNSEIISEKMTYAKLYQPYDWIIAMGVHLDDVAAYAEAATQAAKHSIRDLLLTVAAITALLMTLTLAFFSLLEKWYHRKTNKEYTEKIYRDDLTMVYNRRAGENLLGSLFSNHKITGQNATILMIDIDNFKRINDTCGHEQGDQVLKQIAGIITQNIRGIDLLCRWGGDEFLMVCPDLPKSGITALTDKLLDLISNIEVGCLQSEETYHVTISIGVASFAESDANFGDTVRRADKALYCSKDQGKNCAFIDEPEVS